MKLKYKKIIKINAKKNYKFMYLFNSKSIIKNLFVYKKSEKSFDYFQKNINFITKIIISFFLKRQNVSRNTFVNGPMTLIF